MVKHSVSLPRGEIAKNEGKKKTHRLLLLLQEIESIQLNFIYIYLEKKVREYQNSFCKKKMNRKIHSLYGRLDTNETFKCGFLCKSFQKKIK